MRWARRRLSYANVVASIALFLALGGGAYALGTNRFVGPDGEIKMCVQNANDVPLVVSRGGACPAGSTPLTLKQHGKRGPRGPKGPKGNPGSTVTPSFMDASMGVDGSDFQSGGDFVFKSASGGSGVLASTVDITLASDDATFRIATAGVYLMTVTIGSMTTTNAPGSAQLVLNGTKLDPTTEKICGGTTGIGEDPYPRACALQRILTLAAPSTIAVANTTAEPVREEKGSSLTIVRIG